MSKYLFYLPRFHTNAAPWVRLLTTAGHEVAVHVSHSGPTESYDIVAPLILARSRVSRFRRKVTPIDEMPSLRAVWHEMRAADPDLVIVRGVTRALSKIAAGCALLQRRRLVIYDQEDPVPSQRTTWLRRFLARLLGVQHFTPRLSPALGMRSWGRATSVPFACPFAPEVASAPLLSNSPPRVLMVAKYRERKGHVELLRALSVLATSSSFEVTLCGEEVSEDDASFCRKLELMAAELGIGGAVRFHNNVPYLEMAALYQAHDIFVLPSRQEPAAVSPIEAAWCGCAVFVAKDCGTRGYVPAGDDFEFFPEDSNDIARCLNTALATPGGLIERREACRRHIKEVAGDELVLECLEKIAGLR